MAEYTHGGDVLTARSRYGGAVLDFSTNLNPLGMPTQAAQAAAGADGSAYPDALCRQLRQAIAAHDGVEAEQVICGCGVARRLKASTHSLAEVPCTRSSIFISFRV